MSDKKKKQEAKKGRRVWFSTILLVLYAGAAVASFIILPGVSNEVNRAELSGLVGQVYWLSDLFSEFWWALGTTLLLVAGVAAKGWLDPFLKLLNIIGVFAVLGMTILITVVILSAGS